MIQHFIITQFSYRRVYLSQVQGQDPLNPKNLEHRFQLFELTCLPSMLNQVEQDFTWILIVDPDLPKKYRERLGKLISGRSNNFIHNYNKETDFGSLLWLKPYLKQNVEFVITTKLDDDDALFTGFTKYIQKHVEALQITSHIPFIKFFGCKDVKQWDFFWSKSAPLGYTKPWTRIKSLPVSAGFTLLCKYPELDFSVLHFGHHLFEPIKNYGNETHFPAPSIINKAKKYHENIKKSALDSNLKWDGILTPMNNFHYLETKSLQVVIANHINNIQYMRMFEASELRNPVNIAESFPGMAIDFDIVAKIIRKYRKSVALLFKAAIRALLFIPKYKQKKGLWPKIDYKYKMLKKTVKGILNMK